MVKNILILSALFFSACSSVSKKEMENMTVKEVDIPKFMGKWYVLAGHFTFLEKDVHNGLEIYKWNEKKKRIDIDYTYNKGSFDGKVKSIPQKAWIYNEDTKAHWKVSPFWPIKADYLVVALADDYSWTAIGVPSKKYLWIMARDFNDADKTIALAVEKLKEISYPHKNLTIVPHQ